MIKSPYNFVPAPAAGEVFHPEWADQVSHDIPFSDGESGEIEFTITAKTPIFIRNGHSKRDHEVFERWRDADCNDATLSDDDRERLNRYLSFSNYNGKYFIPATSIKGMLRNVLEIMTFSKFQYVDDTPFFGLRDMNNNEYKKETNQSQLKSGWLRKDGTNWVIDEVEHGRVRMTDVEKEFKLASNSISGSESITKYKYLNGQDLNQKFYFEKELIKVINPTKQFKYGDLYKFSSNGSKVGTLVFYGHIDNKHYDFIFFKDVKNTYQVSNELIVKMEKLYENEENNLWKFFKSQERIPVFFNISGNQVKHFGFSKLYRLNNGHSLADSETMKYHKSKIKFDFASTLFGNANEQKYDALKGRVFIGHAEISSITNTMQTKKLVLSGPKPSFYPAYIKQTGIIDDNNTYKTYISDTFELSGFKRYPVQNGIKESNINDNTEIVSYLRPLDSETKFKGKIRFHNLRPAEIGALLSALTFHGNEGLFHSLGSAKPYGFGKVSVEVSFDNVERYLSDFESEMTKHKNDWLSSTQLKELFAIAKSPEGNTEQFLVYPKLELPNVPSRDSNEFNNIKKEKKYLEPYSNYNGAREIKSIKQKFLEKQELVESEKMNSEIELAIRNQDSIELKAIVEKYPRHDRINELTELVRNIEISEFDAMLTRKNLEELLNFKTAHPFHDRIDEVNRIIKELAPVHYPERFRTIAIDNLMRESAQERNRFVIEQFLADLMLDIERGIREALKNRREAQKWQSFDNHHTWGKVICLIGEESAKQLFEALTNPQ